MGDIFKKLLGIIFIFTFIFFGLPFFIINFDKKSEKNVYVNNLNNDNLTIDVYRHESDTVEEMELEKYLEGVVAAEMPAKFGIEALKAQAIASRTYALSKIMSENKIHNIADVCDTIHSQAYIDEEKYEDKFKSKVNEYISKIREAVNETRGEVLFYDGKIVKNALYFAVSSGVTEDASDVFSFSEPYLRSVDSKFDQDAPNAKKEYVFKEKEFLKIINDKYENANVGSFNDIKIVDYNNSGSIGKIKLGNEIVRGLDFRYLFKLNSSNISMKKKDDNIVINVKGYGHGVGLSQWGAGKMAELGYKYDEILKHYYTGIEIKTSSF